MKLILSVIIFFLSLSTYADTAFEIPRSNIVELKEPQTGRTYPVFIKLPRSYKTNTDKQYPVIYLTDASYSFQLLSGATRFPMNSGKMEEAILVAISYSKGSKGASSRIRDYTPSAAKSWKLETGNAAGHSKFIREVVFPFVESSYRTKPFERTYVGNSLGGLFGVYILFNTPEMFSSYIIGSPSVWFDNEFILSQKVRQPEEKTKVYLSVGSMETPEFGGREDMVHGAKLLAKKVSEQGGKNHMLKFVVVAGASHSTSFLQHQFKV